MENQQAIVPITPTRTPVVVYTRRVESEDSHILQSLNFKLQVKVHDLENDISRLREEVKGYKGKTFIYESLTKDLASLRTQLDKTALALLKKCEAYDALKKELAALKSQYHISPKSSQDRPKKFGSSKEEYLGSTKRKLAIYHDIMNMEDDYEDSLTSKKATRTSRPSMGSCGNLAKQISLEEAMPSCLKDYAGTSAPLRNRVLMKLHTLKAASTESLESAGRKSLRTEEAKSIAKAKPKSDAQNQAKKTKSNLATPIQNTHVSKSKPNLNSSVQSLKSSVIKAPPSYRPALGQNNGRVIQMNTSLKKSNSSCSSKPTAKRPAFKL